MSGYTEENNTLMLMSLMKAHNIRKIIVSPGTTNVALVASMQEDSFFELYSAYDERSAAYLACGMATETGEPVALSCTQATASRNYLSGLTEAYYRNLPILAITSTQHLGRIGQNFQQAIDRTKQPVDTVKMSVHIPIIYTDEDEWYCNVLINKALLELRRNGGSPVHLNLTTSYSQIFDVKELPDYRVIRRVEYSDLNCGNIPLINQNSTVAIFVGAHKKWGENLKLAIDNFCLKYNAVVICDQISNYKGKYRINPCLFEYQQGYSSPLKKIDLMIHIGDVTGAPINYEITQVWRVNPDGEIRDVFKKENYVFAIEELDFFRNYAQLKTENEDDSYLNKWKHECKMIEEKIPELPFSNAWIAKNTICKLPENSILHMGIYNSLRHWSFFEAPDSVLGYSNTGGFGIDGGLSSAIGASLVTNRIVFTVIGDLAFFYDLNSLGNRYIRNNLRILLINNGIGTEFKNPDNRAFKLGDGANSFIAAKGHNGNKSTKLIKHFSQDLGFEYISADNKQNYIIKLNHFLSSKVFDKPIIFEVFVDYVDEAEALQLLMSIESTFNYSFKETVKSVLGENGVKVIKKIIKR